MNNTFIQMGKNRQAKNQNLLSLFDVVRSATLTSRGKLTQIVVARL